MPTNWEAVNVWEHVKDKLWELYFSTDDESIRYEIEAKIDDIQYEIDKLEMTILINVATEVNNAASELEMILESSPHGTIDSRPLKDLDNIIARFESQIKKNNNQISGYHRSSPEPGISKPSGSTPPRSRKPRMPRPSLKKVKDAIERLEYKVFDGIDENGVKKNYDLNIFGVRSSESLAGRFDDYIGVFWMNWQKNEWEYHIWQATTDPGLHYLESPLRPEGTAILKEGQYRACYGIGKHHGQYRALVQLGEVTVYRDNNMDKILDMDPGDIQNGYFGINIHRTKSYNPQGLIGKYSAGCQVLADPRDFAILMDICFKAAEESYPLFTYTLLTEEQLNGPQIERDEKVGPAGEPRPITDQCMEMVKKFEGLGLEAYRCPAGVWTIGYGHTGDVTEGQIITEEEAEILLKEDMTKAAKAVEELIHVELTDNQFSALASFTFNLGRGALKGSTLRRKLNTGDYASVPSEMSRWVKATDPTTGEKKTLRGLVRRRAQEVELWLTPDNLTTEDDSSVARRVEVG